MNFMSMYVYTKRLYNEFKKNPFSDTEFCENTVFLTLDFVRNLLFSD